MAFPGRPTRPPNAQEKEFASLMVEHGLTPSEAYEKAFSVKVEGIKATQKARDLARMPRIVQYTQELEEMLKKQVEVDEVVSAANSASLEQLRKFAYKRLCEIRDNSELRASVRLAAITALEEFHDPSTDLTLVMRWVDVMWRTAQAHCPSCHSTFPLHEIQNKELKEYRKATNAKPEQKPHTDLERRMTLMTMADRRKTPHKGQQVLFGAPERHLVAMAGARAGKSWTLGGFTLMGLLTPGAESWILAKVYDQAAGEVAYLKDFIKTLFHPYENDVMDIYEDKKNGELLIFTKWGSTIRVRSSKSTGAITGRELEYALVAEPAWVPEDIFEELRARMSSRLGRIIAFGTPKGAGGFIGRMVTTTGRDPKTQKIIRRPLEDRLIANGSKWDTSMLVYNMDPTDNPDYVRSELDAARMELTDEEYESEFQGIMGGSHGAKFPYFRDHHLTKVSAEFFRNAQFVLGIDQGPRNFGACLVGWDGSRIVAAYEFFDKTETTMRANLMTLHKSVPAWIRLLGGDPDNWNLTITDKDPPIWQIIDELKDDPYTPMTWKTDIVERHKNRAGTPDNWRRENQEYLNNLAKENRVLFHVCDVSDSSTAASPGAYLLFEQMRSAQDRLDPLDKESKSDEYKGWIIRDKWRGDHVCDAFYYAVWTICSGQVSLPEPKTHAHDAYTEAQLAFNAMMAAGEKADLSGYGNQPVITASMIQNVTGKKIRGLGSSRPLINNYPNDS